MLVFRGVKKIVYFLNFNWIPTTSCRFSNPGLVPSPPSSFQEKTRDFMQVCEKSGAEAITVHMRLREERPAEPAHWDEIARLWDAVKVTGCELRVIL